MVAGCICCHFCLWSVRSPFPKQKVQATSTLWEKGFFGCIEAFFIAMGQCEAGIMEKSMCAPHCSLHKGLGLLQGPIFSHPLLLRVSPSPSRRPLLSSVVPFIATGFPRFLPNETENFILYL